MRAHSRRAARSLAISSKKLRPTAKKNDRRGATWSTLSPAASAHLQGSRIRTQTLAWNSMGGFGFGKSALWTSSRGVFMVSLPSGRPHCTGRGITPCRSGHAAYCLGDKPQGSHLPYSFMMAAAAFHPSQATQRPAVPRPMLSFCGMELRWQGNTPQLQWGCNHLSDKRVAAPASTQPEQLILAPCDHSLPDVLQAVCNGEGQLYRRCGTSFLPVSQSDSHRSSRS